MTVLTTLTFVIAWPSHRLHSARSPAYGVVRSPVVARVEVEDVPACCVFDADIRI